MIKKLTILLMLFWVAPFVFAQEESNNVQELSIDIPELPGENEPQQQNAPGETGKTTRFQGEFHTWLGTGLKEDYEHHFLYSRIQLGLVQLYKDITFKITANARYNSIYHQDADDYRRGEDLRLDLKEAYVDYRKYPGDFLKQWNLVLGFQTVNWGKADEVRPTDILSPQDMTLFLIEDRNDRKLGRFGVTTAFNFGEPFRLEALWFPRQRAGEGTRPADEGNPVFTPRALVVLDENGFTMNETELPQQKLSHSDVALKAYLHLLGTDFSFSFYNGYDPTPYTNVYTYNHDGDSDVQEVEFRLSRVTMWGFDFERSLGFVVLRGEAAYFSKGRMFNINPSESPLLYAQYGADGLAEKEYVDATFGLDKTDFLIQRLYVNLQYSVNHVFDYEKGLLTRYGTELAETNHMGIWDVYFEWDNLNYRLEFKGNYSFSHEDYLLHPSFHAKLGMETKVILGAFIFGGEKDTLMGQYQDKTFAYGKIEHLF